jgi:hypothetical protein
MASESLPTGPDPGVARETFERLVGSIRAPDYAVYDQLLPHPVYARQRWISILNPSDETFRNVVLPLVEEARDRLAGHHPKDTDPAQA